MASYTNFDWLCISGFLKSSITANSGLKEIPGVNLLFKKLREASYGSCIGDAVAKGLLAFRCWTCSWKRNGLNM